MYTAGPAACNIAKLLASISINIRFERMTKEPCRLCLRDLTLPEESDHESTPFRSSHDLIRAFGQEGSHTRIETYIVIGSVTCPPLQSTPVNEA